jgi:hypothetical protein
MAKTAKQLAQELHEQCAKEGCVLSATVVGREEDSEIIMVNGTGNDILAAICLQINHLSHISSMPECKILERIKYALEDDEEF